MAASRWILKQLVQVHRAEDPSGEPDREIEGGSNSYKCTEQKPNRTFTFAADRVEATRTSAQSRSRSSIVAYFGAAKQLVQVHRAEADLRGRDRGDRGSNSYKCTEQKLAVKYLYIFMTSGSNLYKCTEQKETFLCFLGMGNNPMVGATVAVAVATADVAVAVATAEAMNK